MPQTNPDPATEIYRRFKDILKRLHALEVTVPIASDSVYVTTTFNTSSTSVVNDASFGNTEVSDISCFGTPTLGTNVEVSGSCVIGLDVTAGVAIGGAIGIQVDGGGTIEPGSGPGIYYLSDVQAVDGGIQVPAAASRVIQVLSPANTQGLSTHSFRMVFVSIYGQTIHFETRTLAINPQ